MVLIWLIGILLAAGILAWLTARWSAQLPRWISLIAIGIDLILAACIWAVRAANATELWRDELGWNWVPSFGIHFHLAMDGLSLLMLLLTFFLGLMAVLAESMDDLNDSANMVLTAPFHARNRKTVSTGKPESVRFELSHTLLQGTFFVLVWPLAISVSTLSSSLLVRWIGGALHLILLRFNNNSGGSVVG